MTPAPAPNGVLSPDEERMMAESENGFPYAVHDVEGDGDSDVSSRQGILNPLINTTYRMIERAFSTVQSHQ